MKCACCGGAVLRDKEVENTTIYKCQESNLNNTELRSK